MKIILTKKDVEEIIRDNLREHGLSAWLFKFKSGQDEVYDLEVEAETFLLDNIGGQYNGGIGNG